MIDPSKRQVLLGLIRSQPEHASGQALVTVTEFFDGNADLGSIGCNLSDHPGLDHFHKVLREIEAHNGVQEVWMQIYDLEEGEWPFSENVLIFGEISAIEIQELCEALDPSEISVMQMDWIPSRARHLKGRKYVNLWWD